MIKAAGRGPLGTLDSVFLGLSRTNTDKLHTGQPIRVNLRAQLHRDLPDLTVVLFAGETEHDLVDDLRSLAPVRVTHGDHEPDDSTPTGE